MTQLIVAMGGGGFSMEPDNPLLDQYVLSLVNKPQPKICFLGQASAESADYKVRFYDAFIKLDVPFFVAQHNLFLIENGVWRTIFHTTHTTGA